MIVVMIRSTGMFLALGDMTGKKLDAADITRGLRADGVGTILGGLFNAFPYTSFSQNVGLVGVTGIRSRFVAVAGGAILILLSLVPKLAAVVAAVPVEVLGGAGIVMFGMVAATGVRILGGVDFRNNRNNLFIVAIGVGAGLIPAGRADILPQFLLGAEANPRFGHHPDDDRRRDPRRLLQRPRLASGGGGQIGRRRPRRRSLRSERATYPE